MKLKDLTQIIQNRSQESQVFVKDSEGEKFPVRSYIYENENLTFYAESQYEEFNNIDSFTIKDLYTLAEELVIPNNTTIYVGDTQCELWGVATISYEQDQLIIHANKHNYIALY